MSFRRITTACLFIFLAVTVNGCMFAGDHKSYELFGSPGFLLGIWHGSIILWSSLMAIFSDAGVIAYANDGLTYRLGYFIGVAFFSWNFGLMFGWISILIYLL